MTAVQEGLKNGLVKVGVAVKRWLPAWFGSDYVHSLVHNADEWLQWLGLRPAAGSMGEVLKWGLL